MMFLLLLSCHRSDPSDEVPSTADLLVDISPQPLRTDDVATATVTDADGQPVAATVAWTVNGAPIASGSTLDGALWFDKGQAVQASAFLDEAEGTSAAVTVANTPPGDPSLALAMNADGDLVCDIVSTQEDPDDDPVTYTFTWTADGSGFTQLAAGTHTGDTVPSEQLAKAGTWVCAVSASDGEDGGSAEASFTVEGPAYGGYWFEPVALIDRPTDMLALPDGRLLIATLPGELLLVDPTTGTVDDSLTLWEDEQDELISIVLDPRFGDGLHDYLYGWFTRTAFLTRWELNLDPLLALDPLNLVAFEKANFSGHTGGDLLWWDGETDEPALYIAIGPHTEAPPAGGQIDSTMGNSLVAVFIDDETGELTPALDSPFEEPMNAAIGLRNPWRIVDCGAALCVPDPGNTDVEEINIYTGVGQNFGSPDFEGPSDGSYDDPAVYWAHDEWSFIEDDPENRGVLGYLRVPATGVYVQGGYGGRLDGHLLYGEFYDGWIRALQIDDNGQPTGQDIHIGHMQYLIGMAQVTDGTIYALDYAGSLRRMIYRADRPIVGEVGSPLSETDYADATVYELAYPFWSNGAVKERRITLPAGSTIDTSAETGWEFPDGTRLYKSFTMNGEPVEVRLIEKQGDVWASGVYVYDGDDAYLTDGSTIALTLSDGSPYTVPSTTTCAECHDATRGQEWPLGPNPFQLGDDNLAALYAAGLLDAAPDPAPQIDGDATEQAARAYLHANCAFCHQPDGVAEKASFVELDWSYDADPPLDTTAWYYNDSSPWNPNLGDPLITPGDPDDSVVVSVMEEAIMPPVGVWIVDEEGIGAVRDWISEMSP